MKDSNETKKKRIHCSVLLGASECIYQQENDRLITMGTQLIRLNRRKLTPLSRNELPNLESGNSTNLKIGQRN